MQPKSHFSSPIAIVGMAFRFPGDLKEETALWNALSQGKDFITQIPSDRWATTELQHNKRSEQGRSITFSAGVLSRIDEFDAEFFGIAPREAAWLDPQQRLLLELSWEAMENAGIPVSNLSGTDCAVYVGISSLDYGIRSIDDLASMTAYSMTGNTLSLAANRLSYVFDLHGPSLAVDTACSSSLVALHQACQAIQNGETETALVGGVSLLLHPYPFVGFTKASMLSADGLCKVFDADGKGYVRSEGGAVLLLKPLDQALADKDQIHAIIRGTGVNADGGRKIGLTIPSQAGQVELMRSVLKKSGLTEQDIDFIEAHGTGTAIGDPIEAAALGEVYGSKQEQPLPVRSVKANLGHLEAASGMAGLVKTVVSLKNKAIPPQAHLNELNPHIDFTQLNLQITSKLQSFSKDKALIAGVNSFGFGGANAHAILEEYQATPESTFPTPPVKKLPPLCLSASSSNALEAMASLYLEKLADIKAETYYNLAYGAAYKREWLNHRLAVHGKNPEEIATALTRYLATGETETAVLEDIQTKENKLAFVYSGNGAQWLGMGQQLLTESPSFLTYLQEVDALIQPQAGFSILKELQANETNSRLDDTSIAQPLLFAIQVGLTQLLQDKGIYPDTVLGHSVGEVAAAWAAGIFDLATATQIILERSKHQALTRGSGKMAVINSTPEQLKELIATIEKQENKSLDLSIAGINSANNLTLAGSIADLKALKEYLNKYQKNTLFRLLDLDYAFHSPHMDKIEAGLLTSLATIQPLKEQKATFISTVTGKEEKSDYLNTRYWWHNIRQPVQFAAAIQTAIQQDNSVFIEIGPNAILQRYLTEGLTEANAQGRVLSTLRKNKSSLINLQETLLRTHLLMGNSSLKAYFPYPGKHLALPNYPWQRESYWHPNTSEGLKAFTRQRIHPLLGWELPEQEGVWENILDPNIISWLADHQVGDAIVYPGAAYVEMALAAAKNWQPKAEFLAFEELDLVAPMVFSGENARTTRFELNQRDGSFQIKSRQRLSQDEWTLHAAGRLLTAAKQSSPQIKLEEPIIAQVNKATHYRLAETIGLQYGPTFQGLMTTQVTANSLKVEVNWPSNTRDNNYLLHPAQLDVCYQSILSFYAKKIEQGQGVALLPVKTGQLTRYSSNKISCFYAQLKQQSPRSVLADFELLDDNNQLVAKLSNCRFKAAPLTQQANKSIARWQIQAKLQPHTLETSSPWLPATSKLLSQLDLALKASELERDTWFKEALPLFEAFVLSSAFEALQKLTNTEANQLTLATDTYANWLINLLIEEGLAEVEAGQLTLASNGDLPSATEIWQTLMRDYTSCLPQLVLLGRISQQLPQLLLASEEERTHFAQKLNSTPLAEMLYDKDAAYQGTRLSLETLLTELANNRPKNQRLKVLEISSRLSELPQTLLKQLAEDQLDYTLALPTQALADKMRADYANYPNLQVITLDFNLWQTSEETPLVENSQDLVILRHSLHLAPNLKAALKQTNSWLVPQGKLVIAENHPDWSADLLHGLNPNWWHTSLTDAAAASSLLTAQNWLELLQQEGFTQVTAYQEPAAQLAQGAYLIFADTCKETLTHQPLAKSASWLFLVDNASQGLAEKLASSFKLQAQQVNLITPVELAKAPQHLTGYSNLVNFCGWDSPVTSTSNLLTQLVKLLNQLTQTNKQPRLWVITRSATVAKQLPIKDYQPSMAAVWGLMRVAMNEAPSLNTSLFDLSNLTTTQANEALERELLYPDGNNEIALTPAGRYALEWVESKSLASIQAVQQTQPGFTLDFHLPGQLRNLRWLKSTKKQLAANEVEVQVEVAGLNFRDIMYVMGLLPDEAVEKGFAGASLGLEFAGRIQRTGSQVTELQTGDRVMGFGSACFSSQITTPVHAVTKIPDHWSFADAATVPTVFFTVYYALHSLARLQAGEKVLIHGGAGGIGLAAIQLAKHLGAEIYVTAGSEEKRDLVKLLGADYVFDSRSLNFAEEIMQVTQGEGVDIVLNSLAGEAIRRNLSILKPFGRFLELGKRDFFENTPIGLRPFKDNISYFGIDADQLLVSRPELATQLFKEVMQLFQEGVLTPLPYQEFKAEQVVEAFRFMQQARHLGKVVVNLANAQPQVEVKNTTPAAQLISSAPTWLVTGGLAGFGLASAQWLAAQGAKHLILIGRRGADTPGAKEAIAELEKLGIQVTAQACDVTQANEVKQLIQGLAQPLTGILHAAASFDDALIQNLNQERIAQVVEAKLIGAWNLHQASLNQPLQHFILYSSITTALGNPGQANYVAANLGLESLAARRRSEGLPAACLAWGPIADTGYLTRNEAVKDSLAKRLGKPPLLTAAALDQLALAIKQPDNYIVANFDWPTLSRVLPSSSSRRFATLNRDLSHLDLTEDDLNLDALLANKTPDEVKASITQLVTQEVAKILVINPERITPSRSLHDLGLDSLMAVELALGLEQRVGVQLPVMLLNDSPSVEKVTHYLTEKLLADETNDAPEDQLNAATQALLKQHGEHLAQDEILEITAKTRQHLDSESSKH